MNTEVYIMQAGKGKCKGFAGFEEMAEVGTGKVLAGIAPARRIGW
jgi:hypothetical protein